ncbi:MAG: penicillin-binding protein activator LpoB [Acidobacteriota bacterium]|jgi:TolB-like protein
MKRDRTTTLTCCLAVLLTLAACSSGGPRSTEFTNPRFNFGFVERVAVIPFENLSNDRQAGARATRLMITELLATGAVDVVEPGEVQAALNQFGQRVTVPSTEQVITLGERLGVQALILGSVTESSVQRSGTVGIPVVSLDVHMVEAETGATVWAASHTEKGGNLGARLLGTTGEPISETTRETVRAILDTLIN